MSARLILIGGGARSGKSAFALAYARRLDRRPVFLATAQALDDEMRARVARHRHDRGDACDTVEAPVAVVEALERAPRDRVVLVDCLTLWLSNLLLADVRPDDALGRIEAFGAAARARAAPVLIVTNEVGLGLVPETPLGRAFRDVAGAAHQRLAAAADEVYAALLGLVVRLHPAPLATYRPLVPGDLP
jgi:adenosylcobinamide kinase/adenosylcobinamide-phosphate guanylyltransferase